jgi:hypothetical protein
LDEILKPGFGSTDCLPTLTVMIVNWNRCDELKYLLTDLFDQSNPADEIIVVDKDRLMVHRE